MRTSTFMIITISLLNLLCTGFKITPSGVKSELERTAESIRKNRENIYSLDRRGVGREGYYYVLKNSGVVSYHPKKGLIGSDFSRFAFVERILKERNGCFTYSVGGVTRYIFFTEIDSKEILCLSLDEGELSENSGSCGS